MPCTTMPHAWDDRLPHNQIGRCETQCLQYMRQFHHHSTSCKVAISCFGFYFNWTQWIPISLSRIDAMNNEILQQPTQCQSRTRKTLVRMINYTDHFLTVSTGWEGFGAAGIVTVVLNFEFDARADHTNNPTTIISYNGQTRRSTCC